METWQGKHFSITDPEGVNTVIYQINKTPKDLTKEYPKYTVDRLDYTEELRGNMKRKTFYVDFPTYEDELLILSFAKDKVVVNTAIMADDKISISKKPMPLKCDSIYSEEEKEVKDILNKKIKKTKKNNLEPAVVVFSNIAALQMDQILSKLKNNSTLCLKAVVTATNYNWTFEKLVLHLLEEYQKNK